VARVTNVLAHGRDPCNTDAYLVKTCLSDLSGRLDFGVDFRIALDLSADVESCKDLRPGVRRNQFVVQTRASELASLDPGALCRNDSVASRTVALSWDRPFGSRAVIMVCLNLWNLSVHVVPELFRDLGSLCQPGYPYLISSAPAPVLSFNGRFLIVTLSNMEVWVMADERAGDTRSIVVSGDMIAKVNWAVLTGRNVVEVSTKDIRVELSQRGVQDGFSTKASSDSYRHASCRSFAAGNVPLVYPTCVSVKYDAGGYDPPACFGGKPIYRPGSTLSLNVESLLARIDVNDTPILLAVGSRFVHLSPSAVSARPPQPGRFDEWIDRGCEEDGNDSRLDVDFSLPQVRLLFSDESGGRHIPIMELRGRQLRVASNVPWMTNAGVEVSLDLFNQDKAWWEPGIERFSVQITASQGRSGSTAVSVRAGESLDINVTPSSISGAARVGKALKSAIEGLNQRSQVSRDTTLRRLGEGNGRRPSVAAFCVQNHTGRPASVWLPHDSTRRTLRGDGAEVEIDVPNEDVLWHVLATGRHAGDTASDANQSRHSTLRCLLAVSGYEVVALSTAEVGVECLQLRPEVSRTLDDGNSWPLEPMHVAWDVSMRDGVPMGCIRSVVRIVNETRTVLEVSIGRPLAKSRSSSAALGGPHYSDAQYARGLSVTVLEANGCWCVPVHAVEESIRIRPALFHAPEGDDDNFVDFEGNASHVDGGGPVFSNSCDSSADAGSSSARHVLYSYTWSDPLSRIDTLRDIGETSSPTSITRDSGSSDIATPVLSCRSTTGAQPFSFSILPVVDRSLCTRLKGDSPRVGGYGWIDVRIQAPIVIQNVLPRPVTFVLADSQRASLHDVEAVLARGVIEPLRTAHIHTAGSNLERLAFGLGYNNTPGHESKSMSRAPRAVASIHGDMSRLSSIPIGLGRQSALTLKLDTQSTASFHNVIVYAELWIQNRSDVDLFFRDSDRDPRGHGPGSGRPKAMLRGDHLPEFLTDSFVCMSGPWLSLQRADATEDTWVHVTDSVFEIDKSVPLPFEGLGLAVDVRPARGMFHRALIVTVRNTGWIRNSTELPLQWCQPAALSSRGIVLATHAHVMSPGSTHPLHWDFVDEEKAVCIRRADGGGASDWIWSRPVSVEQVEGEFAAKMYRPKNAEQYIARAVVARLENGSSIVNVHPEDRSTPPYRIVNKCVSRSIAFRQAGADESHPWLVRPGKTTRYSWDNPRAPAKHRSLIVEVIDTGFGLQSSKSNSSFSGAVAERISFAGSSSSFGDRHEGRRTTFELRIDMVTDAVPIPSPGRFTPRLGVSVGVDGPTKVISFFDKEMPHGGAGDMDESRVAQMMETKVTQNVAPDYAGSRKYVNLDFEIYVKGVGLSMVDNTPTELAYLRASDLLFRLDRFDTSELMVFEIGNVQIDNQLFSATWPVALWSPLPDDNGRSRSLQNVVRKPVLQITTDGMFPRYVDGISRFRGIFAAVQQLELAADEDFVLRMWLFMLSLLEASGEAEINKDEDVSESRVVDSAYHALAALPVRNAGGDLPVLVQQLYVERLELCPLKLTVSFTSSRSDTVVRLAGYRTLIRTLMAAFGNVENAEFRLNALELQHVFDTSNHLRSLIIEYYVAQGLGQKMALLTSNPLVGNPSALFDSIAVGARDFFVEPSKAKGSAEFIAGIGRGSSSLLTNTVGGIVGSLGGIPRAVSRGLETAVGDKEYLAERDSIRGRARFASSPAQGLFTGAMSFGHGIASGAAGLVREPVRGALRDGPSGFLMGIGSGFIGGVLKPLTGALDLLGEPAVGFRSMMTTSNRAFAEPFRPARAFWGLSSKRLVSYDENAALGQAILSAIGSIEETRLHVDEQLVAWTPLVTVADNTPDCDLISFLWCLHRRSSPSSHGLPKAVMDGHGNPQRAEKMRCALVTQLRLIVASLDGHVLWEHRLSDVIDTKVSLEPNSSDCLMIGIKRFRPRDSRSGNAGTTVAPTTWEKILCGSPARRDVLKAAIRKATLDNCDRREPWLVRGRQQTSSDIGSSGIRDPGRPRRLKSDVEMIDFASLEFKATSGRSGSYATSDVQGEQRNKAQVGYRQSELKLLSWPRPGAVRSVQMRITNGYEFRVDASFVVTSGRLVFDPEKWISPGSSIIWMVDSGDDGVTDVSGCVVLRVNFPKKVRNLYSEDDSHVRSADIRVSFINPMLAPNAFSLTAPPGVHLSRSGGDAGDKIDVTVTLSPSIEQEST
jgi:Vacuolar-sorting-associated 13 protein C-terminal/SHR-binding domain of vacuolar-sorting associated protein 13